MDDIILFLCAASETIIDPGEVVHTYKFLALRRQEQKKIANSRPPQSTEQVSGQLQLHESVSKKGIRSRGRVQDTTQWGVSV